MRNKKQVASDARPVWQKPELNKLGTLRDIAGPNGFGTQAGPNNRS